MNTQIVLASAGSRLLADVMMIRLRRAEISPVRISAVFMGRYAPNSVCVWSRHPRVLASLLPGETVLSVGPLKSVFGRLGVRHSIAARFQRLGLDRRVAERFQECVCEGQTVLAVQAEDEAELAVAWHIFNHCRAGEIAILGQPKPTTARIGVERLSTANWATVAA